MRELKKISYTFSALVIVLICNTILLFHGNLSWSGIAVGLQTGAVRGTEWVKTTLGSQYARITGEESSAEEAVAQQAALEQQAAEAAASEAAAREAEAAAENAESAQEVQEVQEPSAQENLPEVVSNGEEVIAETDPGVAIEGSDFNTEEMGVGEIGYTEFVEHEPVSKKTPYFQDNGLKPLTTVYPYISVEDDYFTDAVFIGDSRMLGIYDYAGLPEEADFFCENGFSIYKWTLGSKVKNPRTQKSVDLATALSEKTYGKIYVMAGMNDMGFGNTEMFVDWFGQFYQMLRETQPDAIIYLMANLTISRAEDGKRIEMDNINVNEKNCVIARYADGIVSFYLDANGAFQDEEGYLRPEFTFDGFHLYAAQYKDWVQYLRDHAVPVGNW